MVLPFSTFSHASHYLRLVGIQRIILILIIGFTTSLSPVGVYAVNSEKSTSPSQSRKEEKRMDELSLIAYFSTIAGIASLFIIPVASLVLMPAGFLLGMIAFLGGRKRFENRRGRGLALAAVALGGAYTLVIFGSLLAFALFGF
jgi:hypothetical protein